MRITAYYICVSFCIPGLIIIALVFPAVLNVFLTLPCCLAQESGIPDFP